MRWLSDSSSVIKSLGQELTVAASESLTPDMGSAQGREKHRCGHTAVTGIALILGGNRVFPQGVYFLIFVQSLRARTLPSTKPFKATW